MISTETILESLPNVLKDVSLTGLGEKQNGKVRDFYVHNGQRVLVTTDRQSAFDVNLGHIPFKGAVLNQLAAFWFEQTRAIIPNHLIAVPDPNVTIAKECVPIPIEMIVRGYMSGVTNTSIWGSYALGDRVIYGLKFPDGLSKNQRLATPIMTPTTHGGGIGGHDERLTREEILERELVDPAVYARMESAALALFDFGSKLCLERGLILVDTKYEFGLVDGELVIMDEMHTPDSSRFWRAGTYEARIAAGQEPENVDKEFLRLWFKERGYSGDGQPPAMSRDLIAALSSRYIEVFETLTGRTFEAFGYPNAARIQTNVAAYFAQADRLSYAASGVDVEAGDRASHAALNRSRGTYRSEVAELNGVAVFGAEFAGYADPVLLGATDGVGTKLKIAFEMNAFDTVGIDLVAMCVNDLARRGAEPIFYLPYLALNKIDLGVTDSLMAGIEAGCIEANCAILGGETAEMGDVYRANEFDLAGSAIGVVERARLIDGSRVVEGDVLFGVPSSGLHSNGFSLIQRALFPRFNVNDRHRNLGDKTLGEELLTPTRIYVRGMKALVAATNDLHGVAHVTGGGLGGRLAKLMPAGLGARLDRGSWVMQPIFAIVQEAGDIEEPEMHRSLNMGIGFVIAAPHDQRAAIVDAFSDARVIGQVVRSNTPFGFE